MAKFITFFMLTLLLGSALVFAGRPNPEPHVAGQQNLETGKVVDETCEGIGEGECLMRRTLAAHLDYIYTQEQHE